MTTHDSVAAAVEGAWLVIECIPERIELKINLFEELDRLTEPNTILATNSSSFKSSEMIGRVARPERGESALLRSPPARLAKQR